MSAEQKKASVTEALRTAGGCEARSGSSSSTTSIRSSTPLQDVRQSVSTFIEPSLVQQGSASSVGPAMPPRLPGSGRAGVKDDAGKLRYDLLPWKAIQGLVRVLTFGARKYTPNGWRSVPDAPSRYGAALLRHFAALSVGETLDPESGLRHIDHVLCNAAFLAELED